jgi:hypothetical protein
LSDGVGNIFVPDGFGNARVAKLDDNGKFPKRGVREAQPGDCNLPLSIAMCQSTRRKTYRSLTEDQRIPVFNMGGTDRPWRIDVETAIA